VLEQCVDKERNFVAIHFEGHAAAHCGTRVCIAGAPSQRCRQLE
jgi:hypothetical protein